ncbi:hypothetical protein [Hydrocarboniphaga sp.]|uniref:hypothetical protein n=1 Tax=Hydrocarboniphaga sp. TaxID=2033016 RepID=UPI0026374625|nr:hypothetical protein [Hydrocarboniphaga sp.]
MTKLLSDWLTLWLKWTLMIALVGARRYLSDGGHFENTAAYELIRRRLPLIIVADCGADPGYQFDDVANLVRKARINLGAEICFLDESELRRIDALTTGKQCSFGSLGELSCKTTAAAWGDNDDAIAVTAR